MTRSGLGGLEGSPTNAKGKSKIATGTTSMTNNIIRAVPEEHSMLHFYSVTIIHSSTRPYVYTALALYARTDSGI